MTRRQLTEAGLFPAPERERTPEGYTGVSAEVSPCGRYRYRLGRRWRGGGTALFVMFNPSTADAFADDPTIRRCRGFADRWGLGAIEVVNLFAWRAKDPKEITAQAPGRWNTAPHLAWGRVIGPENDRAWREALEAGPELVVAAWGAFPLARDALHRHVLEAGRFDGVIGTGLLHGRQIHAVRVTSAGDPGHPLYAPYGDPLPWSPERLTPRAWR